MFTQDVTWADKYSELGAFRHKKQQEISADKVFKLLEQQEEQLIDSDQDNDYYDDLTKNTLDDPDYED